MVILASAAPGCPHPRPNRRRGRIRKVQARVGQSDVVDDRDHFFAGICSPNRCVDVIAQSRRLFDTSAGTRAHVNFELARIHRRERSPGPSHGTSTATEPTANTMKHNEKDPGVVHDTASAAARSRRGTARKPRSNPIWKRTNGLRLAFALRPAHRHAHAAGTSPWSAPAVRDSR